MLPLLLFILLLMLIAFIELLIILALRRSAHGHHVLALSRQYESDFEQQMRRLLTDPNPLNEMQRFLYFTSRDHSKIEKGPEVMHIFFSALQSRWGLRPIGEIGQTVKFDVDQHRTFDSSIRPEDAVVIIEPGWSINHTTLKYPIVERARN